MSTFTIGRYDCVPCDPDDRDGRGILWMWEPPRPNATYIVAGDPTVGITGWNRTLRTKDDYRTDNACLQVIRVGGAQPDVQVAEWAAPVDAIDFAPIVNFLGKLYAGSAEEGEALVALEVYPGPGLLTQRALIDRFGYSNFPLWEHLDRMGVSTARYMGWYSSRSSRQALWTRGMNHLNSHKAILRSPFLIEEMTDCTPDNFLSATARAGSGRHDDRVVALLIGLWYANKWSMELGDEAQSVEEVKKPVNLQAVAVSEDGHPVTADYMNEQWDDLFSQLGEG